MPNIKIVGTGLLGTSLGLALARNDVQAWLSDQSKSALRLAVEYGAGSDTGPEPDLVIVCVPPDATAEIVLAQLEQHPDALVTDVASVKLQIFEEVKRAGLAERYVGSHPMAGREKGGPTGARADLFFARPWVLTPGEANSAQSVELVRSVALLVGALPIEMSAAEHDRAVALVSHLPQLVASVLAGQLTLGEDQQLALSGQGLRDTTRIAASDPDLWVQIVSQNAAALLPLIRGLQGDLEQLEAALSDISASGSLATIHSVLTKGNAGIARIPGKHGGKFANYAMLTVMIDDSPGSLAKLFTFIGEVGVNIEDFKLEHSPGAPIGLVELQVMPDSARQLSEALLQRGWRLV